MGMKRREFIKGSAILGATAIIPDILTTNSALEASTSERKVHGVLIASKTMVGTLPVLRAFAGDYNDFVSPFVFFDEFGPVKVNPNDQPLRVEAHPHAGVIPITYFLEGSGHHRDSLNYDFQIAKGDFMMFTSGRGAIHMEETGQKLYDNGGLYHGFQIWLNMPAKYKWIDPSTVLYHPEQMAHIQEKNYSADIVLGELFGHKSKIETLFPVFYFHLKLKAGCKLSIPTDPTHNAFAYIIKGEVETEGRKEIKENQVVLYERGESNIHFYAHKDTEILMCGGRPHNEPVFAYGPFVMNNESEIMACYENYRKGLMGNPDLVNAGR